MLPIILQRRTCRKFDHEKAVEKEKIEEIVKAGLHAPSGMNRQLGEIFVIRDPKFRDEYARLNAKVLGREDFDPFYGAPVILLIASLESPFADLDGGAMMENMLLEATNQGLSTCWIHRAKEELKLPETIELFASKGIDITAYEGVDQIALGYGRGEAPKEKILREGRAHYID